MICFPLWSMICFKAYWAALVAWIQTTTAVSSFFLKQRHNNKLLPGFTEDIKWVITLEILTRRNYNEVKMWPLTDFVSIDLYWEKSQCGQKAFMTLQMWWKLLHHKLGTWQLINEATTATVLGQWTSQLKSHGLLTHSIYLPLLTQIWESWRYCGQTPFVIVCSTDFQISRYGVCVCVEKWIHLSRDCLMNDWWVWEL